MLIENFLISFTSLGGYDGDGLDEILEFKPSTGTWILVDRMMSARDSHAVSVISTEEIDVYC